MKRRPWPCPCRLVEQRIDAQHMYKQRKAVLNAKASVDNKGPKLKRNMNLKKLQMEEDRCITIDRENKKLLQRMQEVVTHQQMDCWLKPKKAQSNWLHRKHEQMRIVADNKKILRRLERVRPVFNVSKWEEERKEMERRIRYMSLFDEHGNIKGLAAANALAAGAELKIPGVSDGTRPGPESVGSSARTPGGRRRRKKKRGGSRLTQSTGDLGGVKLEPIDKPPKTPDGHADAGFGRGNVDELVTQATQERAAVRIQSVSRGRATRKHMDEIREQKEREKAERRAEREAVIAAGGEDPAVVARREREERRKQRRAEEARRGKAGLGDSDADAADALFTAEDHDKAATKVQAIARGRAGRKRAAEVKEAGGIAKAERRGSVEEEIE